jgi:hypothetical protein
MKTCDPIEFWSNYCFFLKPTLMPLTVQYLDKHWAVKLLNFIGELTLATVQKNMLLKF